MSNEQGKPRNPYARQNPYAKPKADMAYVGKEVKNEVEKENIIEDKVSLDTENTNVENVFIAENILNEKITDNGQEKISKDPETTETDEGSSADPHTETVFDNTDRSNSFYNDSDISYYSQEGTSEKPPYAQETQPARGLSIASLVFSIASLVCCGGFVSAVLAIVFACIAKAKGNKSGMTTAGLVIGILSMLIWVFLTVLFIFAVIMSEDEAIIEQTMRCMFAQI